MATKSSLPVHVHDALTHLCATADRLSASLRCDSADWHNRTSAVTDALLRELWLLPRPPECQMWGFLETRPRTIGWAEGEEARRETAAWSRRIESEQDEWATARAAKALRDPKRPWCGPIHELWLTAVAVHGFLNPSRDLGAKYKLPTIIEITSLPGVAERISTAATALSAALARTDRIQPPAASDAEIEALCAARLQEEQQQRQAMDRVRALMLGRLESIGRDCLDSLDGMGDLTSPTDRKVATAISDLKRLAQNALRFLPRDYGDADFLEPDLIVPERLELAIDVGDPLYRAIVTYSATAVRLWRALTTIDQNGFLLLTPVHIKAFRQAHAAITFDVDSQDLPQLTQFPVMDAKVTATTTTAPATDVYLDLLVDEQRGEVRRMGHNHDEPVYFKTDTDLWRTFLLAFRARDEGATEDEWKNAFRGQWSSNKQTLTACGNKLRCLSISFADRRIADRRLRLLDASDTNVR